MAPQEMLECTRLLALSVLTFCRRLPETHEIQEAAGQQRRAANSVHSTYRASQKGCSRLEFQAKLGTVFEEADECLDWLEYFRDASIRNDPALIEKARNLTTSPDFCPESFDAEGAQPFRHRIVFVGPNPRRASRRVRQASIGHQGSRRGSPPRAVGHRRAGRAWRSSRTGRFPLQVRRHTTLSPSTPRHAWRSRRRPASEPDTGHY